jgi:SRSO17 transposase
MTARRHCPPAPGPLEDFAVHFDPLFHSLAQRRSFRTYLAGLLAPRDRPKTLTALAGAEPVVQAHTAPVQQMQFFLSESNWDAQHIAERTLQLLLANPLIAPSADGALAIDDTGHRKDGGATDHVARQYLGSVGKIDNGIVGVTTLWANEQRYYPLHVVPYTPESCLPAGRQDPQFHSKPQLALDLIKRVQASGIPFEAIVADSAYGDNRPFIDALNEHRLPYVMSHSGKASRGRGPDHVAHTFEDAARELPMRAWQRIVRRFRDGHTQRWWAAELTLFRYGADAPIRAVCATTDRRALPDLTTWYLTTNLPRERAPLSEVVRLYALRSWIEQSYKQMKDELGWADFMVRSDRAIRRHWTLVCCAFAFCWWHEAYEVCLHEEVTPAAAKKKHTSETSDPVLLASASAYHSFMDDPGTLAHDLLGSLFEQAPCARHRRAARLPHIGLRH